MNPLCFLFARLAAWPRRSCLLLTALLISEGTAAESWWDDWSAGVKPGLFHGSDDVRAVGLKLELEYRNDASVNDRFLKTLFDYGFRSEAAFATDNRANSEGLYAELYGGIKHTFSRLGTTGVVDGAEPLDPNAPFPMDGATEQVDLPFVHLSMVTRFETDQIFDNYQFTYGPRLGLIHTQQDQLSPWVLLPKIQVDFFGIEVLQSESFEEHGIEEDSYWRLSIEGDWRFEVGTWWAPPGSFWHGFGIHTRVIYYRGIDLPAGAEESGLEDSWYYGGGIHYRIRDSKVGWGPFRMNFVYATVSNGRTQPLPEDQFSVRLGVAFSWNEEGF
jgi:hypothetical protein